MPSSAKGLRVGDLPGVLPPITSLARGGGGVLYAGTGGVVLTIQLPQ